MVESDQRESGFLFPFIDNKFEAQGKKDSGELFLVGLCHDFQIKTVFSVV